MLRLWSKLIFIIFILSATPCYGIVRDIQDNHQVIYFILDEDGNHVTGETATLKIKKISNGYWYDFNDDTFKNSGWTSKSTNLSEDATEEYYYYTFDPPASENSIEQYLFLIDNVSATYGDHQGEIASYQNISNFDYSLNKVILSDATEAQIDAIEADTDELQTNQNWNVWDDASRTLTELDEDNTTIDLDASYVGGLTTWDKVGYSLSAFGIDAIWDELQSGHTTAGTFGKYLDTEVSGVGSDSAEAIADAVWDETLSEHQASGSTGKALSDASAAGDPWTIELPGAYTGSQAGKIVGDNLDAKVSTRATPEDVEVYVGQ